MHVQNGRSLQQIVIKMQDCVSTYIPLQLPSSSSLCLIWSLSLFGSYKEFIYLSLLFVCNKTQSTEATRNWKNKPKELLIFFSNIHVVHTIKSINPRGESPCFSSWPRIRTGQTYHKQTYHRPGDCCFHKGTLSSTDLIKFAKFCYTATVTNPLCHTGQKILQQLTKLFYKLHNPMKLTSKCSHSLGKREPGEEPAYLLMLFSIKSVSCKRMIRI